MDTDRHLARPIINMVTVSPNIILNSPRLNSSECTISNNSSIGYENPASAHLSNCGFTQIPPATTTTLPSSVISGSDAIAEPIPVATITAVTRLNNEMITTTALNIHPIQQQQHQSSQPLHTLQSQQHQQYYQWMQHYQHQHQHEQQQQQQQHQQHQQHQQVPLKPPYYNLHEYQATQTTNPLQDYSTQNANYGNSLFQNEPYKIPTHINIPEHGSIIKPAPIGYQEQLQLQQQQQQKELQQTQHQQHQQQLQSHPLPLHLHFTSGNPKQTIESFSHQDAVKQHQIGLQNPSTIARDNKQGLHLNSRNTSLIDSTANAVTKPYATATPFYTHPYSEQRDIANTYYDNFKVKVPTNFQDSYTNNHNSLASQSHKFYTAAKSQLQEYNFGSMGSMAPITVKPFSNTIQYNNTANNFYPYVNGSSSDKYLYPSVANSSSNTFAPIATHRMPANDSANAELTYRKNSTINNLASSWPWTSDHLAYSNRNRVATTSASRIPTATVAPTHTNYLNQNSMNMQKNSYHAIPDMSPAVHALTYQKSFPLTQNTNTNYNNWYSSSQTYPVPASKDRLPYQLANNTVSATPYLPINEASSPLEANFYPNSRQQCCSQIQNYYYHTPPSLPDVNVRPANISEFTNHTSPHIPYESTNRMPHINQNCRYQNHTINDISEMKKIKNPLDVYPSPPFDGFDTILHGNQSSINTSNYQTAALSLNNSQSMLNHGQIVANSKPVNNFPNDLNQVTNHVVNTFITPPPPPSHIKSTIVPQSISLAAKQSFEPTPTKCALKDYRKPNIAMELCQTVQNTYQNISAESYSENIALNYSQPTQNFTNSLPNTNNKNDTFELSSEKVSDSGIKNLSLRDFIANWNDDEDDGPITEQVSYLPATDTFLTEDSVNNIHTPALEPVSKQTNTYNCSKSREVDETVANNNLDALKEFASNGPCMNLPDILIDIEKSNSLNNNVVLNAAQLSLENFDFEKELDELQINKSIKNEEPTDNNKLTDTFNTITHNDTHTSKQVLNKTLPLNTENNNESGDYNMCVDIKAPTTNFLMELEPPSCHLPTPIDLQTKVEKIMQVKEEVEHLENTSNTNHNASSFEKEYHIFINKINTQNTTQSNITKEQTNKDKQLSEIPKMITRKRKRKHKILNAKKFITEETVKQAGLLPNIQNLPSPPKRNLINKHQRYCRVRAKPYKIRPLYYQLINRIRRQGKKRLLHIKNIRNFKMNIIKKKFIQNPLKKFYSPQNLRQLCVQLLNTDEYRQVFLQHYRYDSLQDNKNSTISSKSNKTTVIYLNQQSNVFDNTSVVKQEEEEHICKDPYCDTCDVIKTLMQSQTYEINTESDTKLNSPYEVSREIQGNNNEINKESFLQEDYLNHAADSTDPIKAEKCLNYDTIPNSIDNEENSNQMNSTPRHDEDSPQTENNKTNLNTGNTMSLTKDEPLNIIQNCLKITKAGTTVNTGNINIVKEEKLTNQVIEKTFYPHGIEPTINSLHSFSSSITTELNKHENKKAPCKQCQSNEEFEMKNLSNIGNAEAFNKEIDSQWLHSPLSNSNTIINIVKDFINKEHKDSHMKPIEDNSSSSYTEDFIGFQQIPQEQNENRHIDFHSFTKIHEENQYTKEKTPPMNRGPSTESGSINDCNQIKQIDINDLTEEFSNSSSATSKSSHSSTSSSNSSSSSSSSSNSSSSSRGSDSHSSTTSKKSSSSDRQPVLPSLTPTKELQQEIILSKSPEECKAIEIKENEICKQELGLQNNPNHPEIRSGKEMKDSEQILDNGQSNDKDQSQNLEVNLLNGIPKLSDLCQTALSSLPSQQSQIVTENPDNDNKSVEEALEEMYRQAGITIDEPIALDDINSKDTDTNNSNDQDNVILLNLHEILSSDESEVYVLQCDVNENILDIIDSLPSHPNDDHDKASVSNDNLHHSSDNNNLSQSSLKETTSTDNRTLHLHLTNNDFNELESYSNTNNYNDHSFVTIRNVVDAANDNDDGDDDLSLIHHEEIVPDNYIKFLREEFFKYLHEKYIQRHSTKFHHANRILRKYRKLVNNNKSR